jgi:glutamate formiminotransferase/formiminotetrahydrofolate cyclodeaminase
VTLDDCVKYAAKLARKVGDAGIPVYCYEASASREERRNLSSCRKGEYEGLRDKFSDPAWKPDYGPSEFNDNIARTGLSVIGARNFLIAVNFNLNSDSVELAKQIAGEVRESGRLVEIGSSSSPNNAMADSPASECGKTTVHLGASNGGKTVRIPGVLKGCKAIGWYIDEYSRAQVSMNITRITETPLHVAFEEVSRRAEAYKAKVTGTELIGMVPQKVLVDAGRYFLREYGSAPYDMSEKAFRAAGLDGARIRRILRAGKNPESKRIFRITARRIRSNEEALMLVAAQAMRLDDLCPFNIPERVIECAAGLNARCVR